MEQAGGGPGFGNALDLDRLFHEGDDQTWELEDWNWDPYAILADPKAGAGPTAKRHKPDAALGTAGALQAQMQAAQQQQAQQLSAGCHAGAAGTLPQLVALPDAAAGFPGMQLGGLQDATWAAQLQLQQQQAMLAQQLMAQQQQQQSQLVAPACAPPVPGGGGLHGRCQALAHGLPFLAAGRPGELAAQQLAGTSSSALGAAPHAAAAAAAAAGGCCAAGSKSCGGGPGLDLSGQLPAAGLFLAPPVCQQAMALPTPTSALAGPGGLDTASVADSASEGTAANMTALLATPVVQPATASPATTRGTLASGGRAGRAAAAAAAAALAGTDSDAAASGAAPGAGEEREGDGKATCQVPGCGRDLTGLKEYHQRYRICDVHIKLPQVMKDGRLQRFCQQCGRFHDLSAFDGNRKSCREQLQKHNARRRRRAALEQNLSVADSLLSAVDDKSDVGKLLQGLLSNPFQLQALRVLLGVQTHPALPAPAAQPAEHVSMLEAAGALPAGDDGAVGPAGGGPGSTYEVSRDIMDGAGSFAPSFESDSRSLRLAAKLFNVTPADLPADLRSQLTGWLAAAPAGVEGYIRPGCVLLTLHMTVSKSEYEEAKVSGLPRLLSRLLSPEAASFWRSHVYMLQLFEAVAVVYHGRLLSLTALDGPSLDTHKLPHGLAVSPLCLVAGSNAQLHLSGRHISSPDSTLVVKGGGQHLAVCCTTSSSTRHGHAAGCCGGGAAPVAQPPACAVADRDGRQALSCVVRPPAGSAGVLWVEVARGAFLSGARPLLLVDDPALAEEVNALQQLEGSVLSASDVDALLLDLGLVLGHIAASSGAPSRGAAGLSHAAIAEKARRLIGFACDQGWVAVARAVLPLAQACCSCATDIVAAVHKSTAQDGLSLLHRAVRSGCAPLVRGLLDWGAAHGYTWPISSGGPSGVTPLHLATLLDDDGVVALMLLDSSGAPSDLTRAAAADGVTPFHLAFQMGHFSLDRVLAGLGLARRISSVVEQQLAPAGWQLLKAAAESGLMSAQQGGALAAAAPAGGCGAGGVPLKERHTSCLDACLYCQSTLPPLLLSIKAKCAGCGVRQPCVQDDEPASPPAPTQQRQQAGTGAGARRGTGTDAASAGLAAQGDSTAMLPGSEGGAGCAHADGRVLSVTALCQTCHANRVLEVA